MTGAEHRVWPLDILVVDDDPQGRNVLVCALRSGGHTVREASTGSEALDVLADRNADVVLCDWELPGPSGLDLCRRVRSRASASPYVYFVLVTGHGDSTRFREAMEAGADDFQRKPVDLDELDARLVLASRVVTLHRRLAEQSTALRRDSRRFFVASRTDALMGIGNRLALDEELEAFRLEKRRYARPASVAIFDIDHFKKFNDTFGHLAGDDALRRIAQSMKTKLRASDRLYRYGGEELVVLLPEQSAEDALLASNRIRRAVEQLEIPSGRGHRVLTVSGGVAELEPSDRNATDWLRRADLALYAAKRRGRNRIEKSLAAHFEMYPRDR